MADFKKLSWMQSRLKPTRMTYEDINPGSGWTNDPGSPSHQLLLDLPGFKKSDVKLQVDDSGTILISGGRRVAENKRARFQKVFKAPEDSDLKKISTDFRGNTFEVNIPKVEKKRKEESEASSSQVREEKNEASQISKALKEEQEQKSQDKREESDSSKGTEENNKEPVIKNGVLSGASREEKLEEKESSEEVKEMKEEPEIKNGALSSYGREEKREERESSGKTREMMEQEEVVNGAPRGELREEKREKIASLAERKEMKEEPDMKNGTTNGMGYESETSKEAKETKEKPRLKGALSEKREEYSSSKETIENGDDNGAVSKDVSEEKKKIPENKGEPDIHNRASSSDMVQEEKREESGNYKEENVGKPDDNVEEQKRCHLVKGKGDSSHGITSEKSVMEKIIDNKGILLASIISFTLGFLMSQKFHKPSST